MKRRVFWIVAVIATTTAVFAYVGTETSKAEKPAYAWLEGTWIGDGFGGTSEEIWSHPAPDGTMMGAYRHFKADGSLNFYEFIILDEQGMRLKHFTDSLYAWEEKKDMVHFKMESFDEKTIVMKGLTFELTSPNTLEIRLRMRRGGELHTEVFKMTRKP